MATTYLEGQVIHHEGSTPPPVDAEPVTVAVLAPEASASLPAEEPIEDEAPVAEPEPRAKPPAAAPKPKPKAAAKRKR